MEGIWIFKCGNSYPKCKLPLSINAKGKFCSVSTVLLEWPSLSLVSGTALMQLQKIPASPAISHKIL